MSPSPVSRHGLAYLEGRSQFLELDIPSSHAFRACSTIVPAPSSYHCTALLWEQAWTRHVCWPPRSTSRQRPRRTSVTYWAVACIKGGQIGHIKRDTRVIWRTGNWHNTWLKCTIIQQSTALLRIRNPQDGYSFNRRSLTVIAECLINAFYITKSS